MWLEKRIGSAIAGGIGRIGTLGGLPAIVLLIATQKADISR